VIGGREVTLEVVLPVPPVVEVTRLVDVPCVVSVVEVVVTGGAGERQRARITASVTTATAPIATAGHGIGLFG
jgi:hypothetical protein